jgi:protein-arginine kinase activator protein McsA
MKCRICKKEAEIIIDFDDEGNALESYYCSQCKEIFYTNKPKVSKIFMFKKGVK